jgi:lysophospholipase L1-like esterase
MGLLDAPSYSRNQADAKFAIGRGTGRVAFLGDSLTANGSNNGANTGQFVGTLNAGTSVGATSLVVNYPYTVANGYSNTTPPAATNATVGRYVIDWGLSTEEYFTVSSLSGTGPYTLTVPALTYAHTANATVMNLAVLYGSQSIPVWVSMLSAGRMSFGGLFAHGGYTTAQINAIYLPLLLGSKQKPGACVVNVGTNDNWDLVSAFPLALTMIDKIAAAGILPVVTAAPPGGQSSTNTVTQNGNKWNHAMAAACMKRGIPFVDTYSLITDDGTGGNPGAYKQKYNVDNTHPSDVGAKAWAQAIVGALQASWPFYGDPIGAGTNTLVDTAAFPLNTGNACMVTDTNADGVPDGWTISTKNASDTVALVSESGVQGKLLSITRAANQPQATRTQLTCTSNVAFTAGHRYRLILAIKATGATAAWNALATVNGTGNGFTTSTFLGFSVSLYGSDNAQWGFSLDHWKLDIPLTRFYHDFTIPAGATAGGSLYVFLDGDPSTPAYNVEVQPQLVDLTYLGAA